MNFSIIRQKRVENKISKTLNDLNSTINTLSNERVVNAFYLHQLNADVLKTFKSLRNDCSTGYDYVTVSLIKPVVRYIASLLVYIVNNCIKTLKFPSH